MRRRECVLCVIAAKYRDQSSSFSTIPMSADVGIVLVDSKGMRAKLLPSPGSCLAAIQSVLPLLMKTRSETLLDEVTRRVGVLASHPTEVDAFVQKVAMVEATVARLPALKGACARVCEHVRD